MKGWCWATCSRLDEGRRAAPLRIGILGAAKIAKHLARDVAASPAVRVEAVASRSLDTAAAFAAEQGTGRRHGSYDALLVDASVARPTCPCQTA